MLARSTEMRQIAWLKLMTFASCASDLGSIIVEGREQRRRLRAVQAIAVHWRLKVRLRRRRREKQAFSLKMIEVAVKRWLLRRRKKKKEEAALLVINFLHSTAKVAHVTRVVRLYM